MIKKCSLNTSQVADREVKRFPKALALCVDITGFFHKQFIIIQAGSARPLFQPALAMELPASYQYDASFIGAEDAVFGKNAKSTVRMAAWAQAHENSNHIELNVRFLAPRGRLLSQVTFAVNENLHVFVSFMEGRFAQWLKMPE